MTTHSATLREEIEEMIAVGALKPGQHLDETELAARFGVSRTPVRETLIQLASMGLVVIRPRRGAIVAAFEQLHEALRGHLPGHAGDHAAAAIIELIDAPATIKR